VVGGAGCVQLYLQNAQRVTLLLRCGAPASHPRLRLCTPQNQLFPLYKGVTYNPVSRGHVEVYVWLFFVCFGFV
jgi:hypothetical protein